MDGGSLMSIRTRLRRWLDRDHRRLAVETKSANYTPHTARSVAMRDGYTQVDLWACQLVQS